MLIELHVYLLLCPMFLSISKFKIVFRKQSWFTINCVWILCNITNDKTFSRQNESSQLNITQCMQFNLPLSLVMPPEGYEHQKASQLHARVVVCNHNEIYLNSFKVCTSLIPRPPLFFVLRFAFSIIHGSERAVKNGEH